jgi:hypothetical protein
MGEAHTSPRGSSGPSFGEARAPKALSRVSLHGESRDQLVAIDIFRPAADRWVLRMLGYIQGDGSRTQGLYRLGGELAERTFEDELRELPEV